MFLKKKWLAILAVITAVSLLAACGGKKESGQTVEEPIYDNPRNHTAEDFMPLSEGLEKYPVWVETIEDPVRDSKIKNIYVFKKGKVTMYNLDGSDTDQSSVVIEDILDMSDDELIKFARETSNKIYDDYEKEVNNRELFNVESFNESQKEFRFIHEDYFEDYKKISEAYFKDQKPMTEDIYYSVEGEWSEQSSKYTLDIKIDDLGQYTEKMDLIIPKATFQLVNNSGSSGFGDYIDFLFFDVDTIFSMVDNEESFNKRKEGYIEQLKQYGSFEEIDGFELTHPQNFVPNPFVWEEEDKRLSLDPVVIHQKIFDTTFSGIETGSGSLLTRVDDSFVGFRLDSPDTDEKNITIEGK